MQDYLLCRQSFSNYFINRSINNNTTFFTKIIQLASDTLIYKKKIKWANVILSSDTILVARERIIKFLNLTDVLCGRPPVTQ